MLSPSFSLDFSMAKKAFCKAQKILFMVEVQLEGAKLELWFLVHFEGREGIESEHLSSVS